MEDDLVPQRRAAPGAFWVLVPLVLLALLVGTVAAPLVPWGRGTPSESSLEAGFARDMTVHHAQASRMALIAAQRADDPRVRFLAVDLLSVQQSQAGSMQGWLAEWDLRPDSDLPTMSWMVGGHGTHDGGSGHELLPDGRMPGMASREDLAALERASGPAFDRLFLELIITHHRGGLPMAREAAARTNRQVVGVLARSVVVSQQAELDYLSELLVELGGEVPPESEVRT